MNFDKNSKPNVVSHLHQIIKLEHNGYKDISQWPLSNLFFFMVTPKGKDKHHDDYLPSFKEAIYSMKPLNFAYYIKEHENTDHLHGVISIKVPNYKFAKIRKSDEFVFKATAVKSLYACTKYMGKHNPEYLYKLQVVKFHKTISYDGTGGRPKGTGLVKKNVFHSLKLNLL